MATDPREGEHAAPAPPFLSTLLFLVGELIVLGIGAGRVELIARSGDLPQRMALPEMIAIQMALAAMNFSSALNLTSIVGSVIFLYLAALLTGTDVGARCWVIVIVTLWLLALRQLSRLVRGAQARAIVRSLLSTAVIGLPLAEYLIADFSDVPTRWIDPISIAMRQSSADALSASSIVQVALCIVLIIFSAVLQRRRERA